MKNYISNALKQPFIWGSILMIFGSNASNFINYIYHLIMGRLLGPADYGVLATMISLSGLLIIIPSSFSLSIIRYVSAAHLKKDVESIANWFYEKTILAAVIAFIFITVISDFLSKFLNTESHLIIIIGVGFLFSLPSILNRSILQGLLRFKQMILSIFVENSFKLILGVVFVYIGFSVEGALSGLVIAGFVGWFLSKRFIADYFSLSKGQPPDLKPFFIYSFSVLIQSLAMTSLYSTDLILAKHFLSSYDAGIYAALSNLGKIIFYATGPIGGVMFPIIVSKQKKGEDYTKFFRYSLILTSVCALLLLSIYWFQPAIAIKILYGSGYLGGVNLLIWFGIFITLFTLSWLIITYNLSIGRIKVVLFPFVAAILQVIGIWIYHFDIMAIVSVSVFMTTLLLLTLLIYSSYEKKILTGRKIDLSYSSNF